MNDQRLQLLNVLMAVLKHGESLSVVLDRVLPDVDQRQRAWLQEVTFGTLRWYIRLDALLKLLLQKPLRSKDLDIRCLLMSSFYQLEYLSTPDYAVVDQAVATARSLGKSWASGLVNAIMRRYLRERLDLKQRLDNEFGAAVAAAQPDWLFEIFQRDWPDQLSQLCVETNQQAKMTLRVNTQKMSVVDYGEALRDAGIDAQPHPYAPQAWVLEQTCRVDSLPGFEQGWVSVQDAGAQLAAGLLNCQAGDRVLDACAAPGGKTCHLLELQPQIDVLAIDKEPRRLLRVNENLQRLGLSAKTLAADAAATEDWWDNCSFQRILLDVPCSATGVIRRHPDIKQLRRREDFQVLMQTQANLLRKAWSLLAPGGMLLYVTCSISRQENDTVIAEFLQQQDDANEIPIVADWGKVMPFGRQILPGEAGMDGFYYARLKKTGTP